MKGLIEIACAGARQWSASPLNHNQQRAVIVGRGLGAGVPLWIAFSFGLVVERAIDLIAEYGAQIRLDFGDLSFCQAALDVDRIEHAFESLTETSCHKTY